MARKDGVLSLETLRAELRDTRESLLRDIDESVCRECHKLHSEIRAIRELSPAIPAIQPSKMNSLRTSEENSINDKGSVKAAKRSQAMPKASSRVSMGPTVSSMIVEKTDRESTCGFDRVMSNAMERKTVRKSTMSELVTRKGFYSKSSHQQAEPKQPWHREEAKSGDELLVPLSARGASDYSSAHGVGELSLATNLADSNITQSTYWCPSLESFVQSNLFDFVMAVIVLLQVMSLGYQTDYTARNWTLTPPAFLGVANHLVNGVFVGELVLRIIVYRKTFVLYLQRNILDSGVIMALAVDECTGLLRYMKGKRHQYSPGWGVLRIVRIFRLVRIIRNPEFLKFSADLRALFASILDSFKLSFWILVLMLVFTYAAGVYITEAVTHLKVVREDEDDHEKWDELLQYFGTLDRSLLSLYYCALYGMNWHTIVDPFAHHFSAVYSILLASYLTFMIVVVLNIVTGSFVSSALKLSSEDRKQVLMIRMLDFFVQCDEDHSGTISWSEFQSRLGDSELQQFLKEIDLSQDHAKALYRLLDTDNTGDVPINDIVTGCVRLHGPATSIDLATFMRAYEEATRRWNEHAEWLEETLMGLGEALEAESAQRALEQTQFGLQSQGYPAEQSYSLLRQSTGVEPLYEENE